VLPAQLFEPLSAQPDRLDGHLLPAGPWWALAPMRQEEPYHPVSERRRGRGFIEPWRGRVFVGEAWAVAGMGLESVEPDEVIAQDAPRRLRWAANPGKRDHFQESTFE
jgi:hypothetical protein